MHVNRNKPNILQDKKAVASGQNLRDRDRDGNPKPPHKAKDYPYQSKCQIERRKP